MGMMRVILPQITGVRVESLLIVITFDRLNCLAHSLSMKSRSVIHSSGLVLLLVLASLLTACATAPVQEMSDARQALMAARHVGADKHAPAMYTEAKALVEDADHFIAERRYELARVVAGRAKMVAIKARRKAMAEVQKAND